MISCILIWAGAATAMIPQLSTGCGAVSTTCGIAWLYIKYQEVVFFEVDEPTLVVKRS